ncbi:ATP-binding protein [Streptomyces sp. NPDC048577]|uniref:ATP-binding protein n=1 Tax=Streptomyces sp. NPDC048577 TaxID=3157209 RepID=UPI00342E2677
MNQDGCMVRKPWGLHFLAEPGEVAALRRIVRLHLAAWGLSRQTELAQLCVSELVTNVIRHVGVGTPTTLGLSMSGTYLRIEVRDPDRRGLPAVTVANDDEESGRGMKLVSAVAARWGVLLGVDGKATWCEIATELSAPHGHVGGVRISRAEAMLSLSATGGYVASCLQASRLHAAERKDAAIGAIVDLLHWMCAHGCDADDVLDNAQTRYETGS